MASLLVSVVVITYQHRDYIQKCLDGILSQKVNFDFEIILGEDGSTDGTRELCIEYAKKFPQKIKLFLRDRKDVIVINGSETGRFNFIECLKSCRGKYVALCEGDDYWIEDLKLQRQVDFLETNPDFSICFHNVYEKDEINNSYLPSINDLVESKDYFSYDLALGNFIHTPSVVFRSFDFSTLPSWFHSVPVGDYPLHLLSSKNGKIKYFDSPMAAYRIHNGGRWSTLSRRKMYQNWLSLLEVLLQEKFEFQVIDNLRIQKSRVIKSLLGLSFNKNWNEFNEDLGAYGKFDSDLLFELSTKKFPDLLEKYKSSYSYKIGNFLVRLIQSPLSFLSSRKK